MSGRDAAGPSPFEGRFAPERVQAGIRTGSDSYPLMKLE